MNGPPQPRRLLPEPDSATKLITVEISIESATQAIAQLRTKSEEMTKQLTCINQVIAALEAGLQSYVED